MIVVIALVVLVGGYFAYNKFIKKPVAKATAPFVPPASASSAAPAVAPPPASSVPVAPVTAEATVASVASATVDPYAGLSIHDMLVELTATEKKRSAIAAGLHQTWYQRGIKALKANPPTTTTPTVDDLATFIANDYPNDLAPKTLGADIDAAQQKRGSLETYIHRRQATNGLTPNTPAEIFAAGVSGDYSTIRGA